MQNNSSLQVYMHSILNVHHTFAYLQNLVQSQYKCQFIKFKDIFTTHLCNCQGSQLNTIINIHIFKKQHGNVILQKFNVGWLSIFKTRMQKFMFFQGLLRKSNFQELLRRGDQFQGYLFFKSVLTLYNVLNVLANVRIYTGLSVTLAVIKMIISIVILIRLKYALDPKLYIFAMSNLYTVYSYIYTTQNNYVNFFYQEIQNVMLIVL